jgi:MoxR-like ATPase
MTAQTTTTTSRPADLTAIQPAIARLQLIEAEMQGLLLEREETIRVTLIGLLARQHVVLLGAPGSAKSMLVSLLGQRVAPASGQGLTTFVWLLTRFTTPEELFGPISVQGLKKDEYRRITAHKLPEAQLAFLDEIFKANSAVLNALLTILNERAYVNGPTLMTVPLHMCIGASNEMPQGDDLAALWDRFALRVMVEYVSDSGFAKLLRLADQATPPATITPVELDALQQTTRSLPIIDAVYDALTQLRKDLIGKGIAISDRRWRQTLDLMRANALLDSRGLVEEDDLAILQHALWIDPQQHQEIARTVARLANPLVGKAVELGDQAASVHSGVMDAQHGGGDDNAAMLAAVEGNTKLKGIMKQLRRLEEQLQTQGRNPARVQRVMGQVEKMQFEIAQLII